MSAPALDVLPGLRAAIIAVPAITAKLASFGGSFSVHTRRPIPSDAPYPMVVIGPVITWTDEDGLSDFRPVLVIDIHVYKDYAGATHTRQMGCTAIILSR